MDEAGVGKSVGVSGVGAVGIAAGIGATAGGAGGSVSAGVSVDGIGVSVGVGFSPAIESHMRSRLHIPLAPPQSVPLSLSAPQ